MKKYDSGILGMSGEQPAKLRFIQDHTDWTAVKWFDETSINNGSWQHRRVYCKALNIVKLN